MFLTVKNLLEPLNYIGQKIKKRNNIKIISGTLLANFKPSLKFGSLMPCPQFPLWSAKKGKGTSRYQTRLKGASIITLVVVSVEHRLGPIDEYFYLLNLHPTV